MLNFLSQKGNFFSVFSEKCGKFKKEKSAFFLSFLFSQCQVNFFFLFSENNFLYLWRSVLMFLYWKWKDVSKKTLTRKLIITFQNTKFKKIVIFFQKNFFIQKVNFQKNILRFLNTKTFNHSSSCIKSYQPHKNTILIHIIQYELICFPFSISLPPNQFQSALFLHWQVISSVVLKG